MKALPTPVCEGCAEGEPVTADGVHGRRCAACPPTYSRSHAEAMVAAGRPAVAFAHLRTHLALAADRRVRTALETL